MPSASTCHPNIIEDFLADRLTDSQQASFERHLDECDVCCAELQRRTADVQLWDDARTFLSSTDSVPPASTADVRSSVQDLLRLDFLSATDDPHMLGRFGGYEVSGVIGCGGMGIVLKGFDNALNRYAAIKVLAPHYASSGAARQRFAREAQAAAAVVHDNVIAIHGVDEYNNLPYLVMPYVKGESLQKRIDRDGTLSTIEVLRIAMQIAKGLAAAHGQGLVHRDIKPGNILLPENVERVIITDFGLARAADDASLTRSGVIAGTPQYMSPEQAKGEGIDHRSDLFSLGSVMYAMCTGHPPFRAETPYGILRRITDNAHRPVLELRSDVPAWLCSIIDRLLAKEANNRFKSADEVANLLEDCLAQVQQPTTVPLPTSLVSFEKPRALRRLVMFAPVCVVLIAIWWTTSGNTMDQEPENLAESAGAVSEAQRAEAEETSTPLRPTILETNSSATHQVQPISESDLEWSDGAQLDQLESTLKQLQEDATLNEQGLRP